MAHEGVQTSHEDHLTQDKFRELMEMGLKAENERVGREEQIQEKAHKQAGVSWGGVYRDHGIFQNAEKSKEATVQLGRNKLLRVDSVRQEVSLLNHDMLKSLQKKRRILDDLRVQRDKSSKKKEGPPRLLRAARSMDLSTQAYKEAVEEGLFDKSFQETGRKGINSSVLAVLAAKKSGNFNPTDPSVLPKLSQVPKLPIPRVSPPPSEYRLPNINYKLEGALSTDREPFKPSWSRKAPDTPKHSENSDYARQKPSKQVSEVPSIRVPSQERFRASPRQNKTQGYDLPVEPQKPVASKSPVPTSKLKQLIPSKPAGKTPEKKPTNLGKYAPSSKLQSKNSKPQEPRPNPQAVQNPTKAIKNTPQQQTHLDSQHSPGSHQLDHSQEGVQLEVDNLTHEQTEPRTHAGPSQNQANRSGKDQHSGSFTLHEVPRGFRQSSSADVQPQPAAAKKATAESGGGAKAKDTKKHTDARNSQVSAGTKGSKEKKPGPGRTDASKKVEHTPEHVQEQSGLAPAHQTAKTTGEPEFRFDIDSSRAEYTRDTDTNRQLPRKQSESGGLELSGSVQRSVPRPNLDQDDEDTAPEFYITKIEVYY